MLYNKKQRGGKILGQGAFGCAIQPHISIGKNYTNKVSKVIDITKVDKVEYNELIKEYKIGKFFSDNDPSNRHFLDYET